MSPLAPLGVNRKRQREEESEEDEETYGPNSAPIDFTQTRRLNFEEESNSGDDHLPSDAASGLTRKRKWSGDSEVTTYGPNSASIDFTQTRRDRVDTDRPTDPQPRFTFPEPPTDPLEKEEEQKVSDSESTSEDSQGSVDTYQFWERWEEIKEERIPERLTFGVECEFALAVVIGDKPDPDAQDPRQIYEIITTEVDSNDVKGDSGNVEGGDDNDDDADADADTDTDTDSGSDSDESDESEESDYDEELEARLEALGQALDAQDREAEKHIAITLKRAGVAAASTSDGPRIEDWVVTTDHSVRVKHEGYQFPPMEINSPPFYYCRDSVLQVSAVSQIITDSYRVVCNDTTGL